MPAHARSARAGALILAIGAMLALIAASATIAGARRPAPYGGERVERGILHDVNRFRARYGLPPVRYDRGLALAAGSHSRDMVHNHYFAHGAWVGRVRRSAHHAGEIGEVLALRSYAPRGHWAAQLVSQWIHSPDHRAILLGRGFRRIGVGLDRGWFGGERATVATADFASG